jgi:hypothetical protein
VLLYAFIPASDWVSLERLRQARDFELRHALIRCLRVAPTTSMPAVPRMPSSGIVSVYFWTSGRQIAPDKQATTSISQ